MDLVQSTPETGPEDASVLGAAWQHKWLVLAIALGISALSVWVSSIRAPDVVAIASLVLEDPTASDVLDQGRLAASADRVVANQIEVLRSTVVATRAAELAGEQGVGIGFRDILSELEVTSLRDTDVVNVAFTAESETEAITVTGAIVDAYREVRSEQRRQEVDVVVDRVRAAQELLGNQLRDLDDDIQALRAGRDLGTRVSSILDAIAVNEVQLADPSVTGEVRQALEETQASLRSRLETVSLATEVESGDVELSTLLSSREALLEQLGELAIRENELTIEASAQGPGIAFIFPPAVTSSSRGAGRAFTAAAGLFIGLLAGSGVAHLLVGNRRRFSDRFDPESVIGAPLLADVPRVDIRRHSLLPVRDEPRSPAAEAFRFAASSLVFRLGRQNLRVVMIGSPTVGDGKTVVAANLAMAAARSGAKILAIDADFGNQALIHTLVGGPSLGFGLTDLGSGLVDLEDAVTTVNVGLEASVDVLGRGTAPVTAPDFFSASDTRRVFEEIAGSYDLVLIDAPPLTQVAYASAIADLSDAVVIVVRHGSLPRSVEEVVRRLSLIDTRAFGYIYNMAPDRPEMSESGGSMTDILGDRGVGAPLKVERDR